MTHPWDHFESGASSLQLGKSCHYVSALFCLFIFTTFVYLLKQHYVKMCHFLRYDFYEQLPWYRRQIHLMEYGHVEDRLTLHCAVLWVGSENVRKAFIARHGQKTPVSMLASFYQCQLVVCSRFSQAFWVGSSLVLEVPKYFFNLYLPR